MAGSASVAVTGGTGFIGSAVVRRLLADGRRVRALVEPGASVANLDGLGIDDVARVPADVTDFDAMRRSLEGCETLYHLAAVYKTWLPDSELIHRVNVEGTVATLLAARAAGVKRVVYTSSIAAIGVVEGGLADETTAFNLFDVANPYILTKWQSERIAMRFAESGMPIVVVNPGFPFGPRDLAPTPTGAIVQSVLEGKVPGYSTGGFCAIDVDDCADAHVRAEEKGRVGERYILGNHNVTLKAFFDLVAKLAGVSPPRVPIPASVAAGVALGMELWADHVTHSEPTATYRAIRYMERCAFFSNAKARSELGLQTRPLEETVRRAVDWFRGDFKRDRASVRA